MSIKSPDKIFFKKVFLFGAEADENDFQIGVYIEDFCTLLNIPKWKNVDPSLKKRIRKEFKAGQEKNKKTRSNIEKLYSDGN